MIHTANKIPAVAGDQLPSDDKLAAYRLSDTAQRIANAADYTMSNPLTGYLSRGNETHFETGTRISKDVATFAFVAGSTLAGLMLGTVIMLNTAGKQDEADTTSQISYSIAAGLMMISLFASALLAHIRQHCATFDLKTFEDYWLSHLQKGPLTLSAIGGALGTAVSGVPPLIAAGMTATDDPDLKSYATGGAIIAASSISFLGYFSGGARKYAFKTLANQQKAVQVALTQVQTTLEGFKTMLEMKLERENIGIGNIDGEGGIIEGNVDNVEENKTQALYDGLYTLYEATQLQTGRGQDVQKIVQQHALHSIQAVFGNEFVPLPTQSKLTLVEKAGELLQKIKAPKLLALHADIKQFTDDYIEQFQPNDGDNFQI